MDDEDDQLFLRRFEDCTWPFDQWRHRQHIKVAYLYLRQYPLEEAVIRMRAAIKAYNSAHKVPQTPHRGYHETITQAWMQIVSFVLRQSGPCDGADRFVDEHPELAQMKTLHAFYSRERLASPEAKHSFVEPDLAPLPCAQP